MEQDPENRTDAPLPQIGKLRFGEVFTSLAMGWQDFGRAPLYGFFFSTVYVAAGLALVGLGAGTFGWTLTMSLGFPLVAPFAAVGLYEVSRRLEANEPLGWAAVLGVVLAERHRQIPWMGAIILIAFLIWVALAYGIFALFLGSSVMTSASSPIDAFLTSNGLTMMAVELLVGGVFAFFLFAATAVSLPLLLEREVDFVTAMRLSLGVVRANPSVMLSWAAIIAVLLVVGMLPAFLGLFIVLPVLGHATWHLYRRALYEPL